MRGHPHPKRYPQIEKETPVGLFKRCLERPLLTPSPTPNQVGLQSPTQGSLRPHPSSPVLSPDFTPGDLLQPLPRLSLRPTQALPVAFSSPTHSLPGPALSSEL